MSKQRNIMKWHYVTNRDGEPQGLRGYSPHDGDRYELNESGKPGVWVCYAFDGKSTTGDWLYSKVHEGSMYECMVAAEASADRRYEAAEELIAEAFHANEF